MNTMDRVSESGSDHTLFENPSSGENPTLHINFTWKNFKALVTEQNSNEPSYIIDYNTFKSPHLVFHPADDKTKVIGSGTLHPISINAKYELHGQKGKLKALRRWVTSYTHLSHNYRDSEDGSPAAMTWTSATHFKTWDFICLDEKKNPVAKFSANCWALKKMGSIEFIGPKAHDPAAREEILVVGLTLFSCMLLRINNIFNFFGAIFARPGPLEKEPSNAATKSIEEEGSVEHQGQGSAIGGKQLIH